MSSKTWSVWHLKVNHLLFFSFSLPLRCLCHCTKGSFHHSLTRSSFWNRTTFQTSFSVALLFLSFGSSPSSSYDTLCCYCCCFLVVSIIVCRSFISITYSLSSCLPCTHWVHFSAMVVIYQVTLLLPQYILSPCFMNVYSPVVCL